MSDEAVAPPKRRRWWMSILKVILVLALIIGGAALSITYVPPVRSRFLAFLVHHGPKSVRWFALHNLELMEESGISGLVSALEHENWDYRVQSAEALANLGERAAPAIPALSRRLEADPEEEVRLSAARALGQIGSPDARAALKPAFADKGRFVRLVATRALGEADSLSEELQGWLIAQLADAQEDWEVRVASCEALASAGARAAETLEALKAAMASDDEDVREAAAAALAALGEERE